MARFGGAAGINTEQLCRRVMNLFGGLAPFLAPLISTQTMQRRTGVTGTGIPADQMQRRYGHIQFGLVGIFQGKEFLLLPIDFQRLQTLIAADAMIDVHHRIAGIQFGQIADDVFGVIVPALAAAALHHPMAEQLGFRHDGDRRIVQHHAGGQRSHGDHRLRRPGGNKLLPGVHGFRMNANPPQHFQQRVLAASGFRHKQYPALVRLRGHAERFHMHQRIGGLGVDRQGRGILQWQITMAGTICFRSVTANGQPWERLQVMVKLVRRQKQLAGGQNRPLDVVTQVFITCVAFRPECIDRTLHAVGRHHQRTGGQIIKQRGGGCKKQRQIVFNAGTGNAVGHVLVHRAAAEVHLERLLEIVAELLDRRVIQREFLGGQQADLLHLVAGALGFRIEGAQRVDFVVEQLDAVGFGAAHREQVHDGAPHRKFTMLVNRIDAAVTPLFQQQANLVQFERLAHIQDQAVARQKLWRRNPVHQGRNRNDQYALLDLGKLVQRRQTLGNDVLMG